MVNKSRIRVLEERDKILDALCSETKSAFNRSSPEYKAFLPLLIEETMTFMKSSPPILRQNKDLPYKISCLKDDEAIVLEAIKGHKDVLLGASLKESSLGGVIVRYGDDDIMVCDNTIERRFSLATTGLLPKIRNILFE